MKFLKFSYVQTGTMYEYQYISSAQTYEKLEITKVKLGVLGRLSEKLDQPTSKILRHINNKLVDLCNDPGFKLQNAIVEYDAYAYKIFTRTLANYRIES
jgi:hypothetical protein